MIAELILSRPARPFIGEDMDLKTWDDVKPLFDDLLHRPLPDADALRQWLQDRSELESYLSENFAWRYIRMTCDTADPGLTERFNYFVEEIQPHLLTYGNELDIRTVQSPFIDELADTEPRYAIMLRSMLKAIELFREENVPLQTELQTREREYGAAVGAMNVTLPNEEGQPEEMTLPKASDRLYRTDRTVREQAWRAIWERRAQDRSTLDSLFTDLINLRHQVAQNAGFANFRDYSFAALGRFDYTAGDCINFHNSVAQAVVPLLNQLAVERKAALNVDPLRPWDSKVDVHGRPALKPFENGEDLLTKTVQCFDELDSTGQLGRFLRTMRAMHHLDLESRKGKAPGGYNYPLEEIGVPFIFMNATSSLRDLVTMVHEGGHAIHSFLTRELPLKAFRNPPMEVAELASMAMELLSMDHWDVFFPNPEALRRARLQHLESVIETLPWIATIDKFQHWLYEHPQHSETEREQNWVRIYEEFTDSVTDWSGLESYKGMIWQKQLHLFEVPFYYIEYGIAQLGAIGVWRNYRRDPEAGLQGYLNALSLGYQATIPEIYAAANVPFDFSKENISELMAFVSDEIKKLNQ
jgi:oligoendopeptidase F